MSPGPYMIGIAGPTGAGKTTLSRHLADQLPGATAMLSLDAYYRDLSHLPLKARRRCNFDAPEALDSELLIRHLQDLARGRAVERPVYRFAEHTRAPRGERMEPAPYLIVEGLFALYWEKVRLLLDTRVFIELDDATCLARRQERDRRARGRTRAAVRVQYAETVRPMYTRYVQPTRDYADLVVCGHDPAEQSAAAVLAHVEKSLARRYP